MVTAQIDPSTLPRVTVDADVAGSSSDLAGPGGQEVAVNLAEDLETETQALLTVDKDLLSAVTFGDRLIEMRQRIDEAISTGETVVDNYRFDSLRISSVIRSAGQAGLSLGIDARGTLEEITYDASGDQAKSGCISVRAHLRVEPADRQPMAHRGDPAAALSPFSAALNASGTSVDIGEMEDPIEARWSPAALHGWIDRIVVSQGRLSLWLSVGVICLRVRDLLRLQLAVRFSVRDPDVVHAVDPLAQPVSATEERWSPRRSRRCWRDRCGR